MMVTMSNSFLTREELIELTDRQMPGKQIEWLKKNRWKYAVSAAGRPKVSREYFSFRVGIAQEEPKEGATEPDYSHWINRERK